MSSSLVPSGSSHELDTAQSSGYPQAWSNNAPEPQGVPIARYLSAVARHKWLILGLLVLGTAAGVLGTRFLKPVYQATASVWLGSGTKSAAAGPVVSDPIEARPNWIELLTSRGVATTIVTNTRLYLTPEQLKDSAIFAGFRIGDGLRNGYYELRIENAGTGYKLLRYEKMEKEGTPSLVESGVVGDSIGSKAGFLWQPSVSLISSVESVAFSVLSPRAAVADLQSRLKVSPVPRTSSLEFRLTGSEPRRTAYTLNTIIDEFVSLASEIQTRNVVEVARRLKEQLDSASVALHNAESALETFRVNT
ncbi:MAG: hypothetical protein LC775_17790, partial [Acidobacteria bacterium]|nr:hypothetical protein [Acidobacteriota bacterium]